MKNGHKVVAISDSKGGIYDENGLDISKLLEHKKTTGTLAGFPGSREITNEELLATPCDLLIPAAFENVITEKNVNGIQATAILELANGPVTPEADEVLFQKGIQVIPDVLANSGGVTVSCFEWEQNLKGEHWSEAVVLEKLKSMLDLASDEVFSRAEANKTHLRMGAFILALERIEKKLK